MVSAANILNSQKLSRLNELCEAKGNKKFAEKLIEWIAGSSVSVYHIGKDQAKALYNAIEDFLYVEAKEQGFFGKGELKGDEIIPVENRWVERTKVLVLDETYDPKRAISVAKAFEKYPIKDLAYIPADSLELHTRTEIFKLYQRGNVG